MRWTEPGMKDWMPVFEEGTGKDRVMIEKGEFDYYRLRYWRGDAEASRYIHASTADEMARNLVGEGLYPEDKAHRIAGKIIH